MMNVLSVENISKSYAGLTLFHKISFQVNKDDKIALISKNGAGKTTLLNMLNGLDGADEGTIEFHPGLSISYLVQEPVFNPENKVIDEVLNSENEVLNTIKQYETSLLEGDRGLNQQWHEKMDALDAWNYEVKVKQILTRLKIDDYLKPTGVLSGGEKKRIALANVLLNNPDFLILDEPTNHLDIDMIEWLEDYLNKEKITLLMVTHDRYFLDRVCNGILELDNKEMYQYKGNYSYFIEKREERLETQGKTVDKARNLLKNELEWLRRMPKARGTKSKKRIEQVYDLQDKASLKRSDQNVKIDIQTTRLGNKVLEMYGISKGFDNLKIMTDFSYKFSRFEKVGIVGKNGTGKSTLLNIITGKLQPDHGEVIVGETVVFGYYHQAGLQFDENQKVIDILRDQAEIIKKSDGTVVDVQFYLNYFLFPHEKQNTFVYKLSGGEKRRLYLLSVLMRNPNFLILDEPTNDLDIITLNILEDYLTSFQGCLIIVSHDRYFMDKLVDHLFVFEGDGKIKDFPGNYTIYRDHEKQVAEKTSKGAQQKMTEKEKPGKKKPANKLSFKEKYELEQLETEIENLENKKASLEKELNDGMANNDELIKKSAELGDLLKIIEEKSDRWLGLSEKL